VGAGFPAPEGQKGDPVSARGKSAGWTALVVVGALLWSAQPASAQLQWKSADEKLAFKIGLLGQLQGEMADVAGTNDTATNLFLRRARILMSFTLGEKLSIFLETDSPNLGKSNNAGVKDANDIFIQDFVVTYKASQAFHFDAGMILPAISYNHTQSAASLLATDYGPYTFVESGPLQQRVGRDYGVQARGYLADNHLEYRAGVLQGTRGTNAANDLRYYGRLMLQFGTPQVGLFYRGTSLGKTKTIAFGASYDTQEEYSSLAGDVFVDLPVGSSGFTGQINYQTIDGDTFLATLPEQDNLLVEAGFYFSNIKLLPFVQYAEQDFADATRVDEEKLTVGLGYMVSGHNNNIKFSYSKIEPKIGESRDQYNLQWQIFQF